MLDAFTTSLKGLAPSSGGGTTNYLRADGTWATPPAGGASDGDKGDITVSASGTIWTVDTSAIGNSKLSDMAALTFKANLSASLASPQDVTVGQMRAALNLTGLIHARHLITA